jgi:hypothetical protein
VTDALSLTALVIFGAGWALLILHWLHKAELFWFYGTVCIGDALTTIVNILLHWRTWAIVTAAGTVIMAWLCRFYWRRRKRRGRLAAIGAKSRARIAAMTARMRERPARPALRPVPGGAR